MGSFTAGEPSCAHTWPRSFSHSQGCTSIFWARPALVAWVGGARVGGAHGHGRAPMGRHVLEGKGSPGSDLVCVVSLLCWGSRAGVPSISQTLRLPACDTSGNPAQAQPRDRGAGGALTRVLVSFTDGPEQPRGEGCLPSRQAQGQWAQGHSLLRAPHHVPWVTPSRLLAHLTPASIPQVWTGARRTQMGVEEPRGCVSQNPTEAGLRLGGIRGAVRTQWPL